MVAPFLCPRCGNHDPRSFGVRNGKPYCRKCLPFSGDPAPPREVPPAEPRLDLSYSLSSEQKRISNRLISNFVVGKDTLVHAVCGAGKTELSYGVIASALSRGGQVGFALPRRDVVIELFSRIKEAFPNNECIAVYGGHHEKLTGDIIVLTTHQLFRYERYFDLLVMDEIDAFPFRGNQTLHSFFEKSARGRIVLLTATPSDELIKEFSMGNREVLELRTRFHRHPMPVPEAVYFPSALVSAYLVPKLRAFQKEGKPCLVFVSSKAGAERLYGQLRFFVPNGSFVHSEDPLREKKISLFKSGRLSYLVTTSVLERGVTVANLQVIVVDSDHERIYDKAALVQIAGRAGRKKKFPGGEVIFVAEKATKSMVEAIKEIKKSNEFLLKLP